MIPWLFRRRRDAELDEEIRTHIRMAIEDRVAHGEDRTEAKRAVRREFGSVGEVKEVTRRIWGGLWFDGLTQDVVFATRQFRRSPGFAAVAVTTIAVSIGLTTSVFSLVNALLFSPLPGVEDPARLVAMYADEGRGPGTASYMDYKDFVDQAAAFSELAAFKTRDVDISTNSGTVRLRGAMVSDNYFRTLGVGPAAGRFFTPEEDQVPGAEAVVVLSHGLWQSNFGGRVDAIGESLTLNRSAFTIVGVTPEKFRGTNLIDAPEIFVPMAMQPRMMPSSGLLLDRRGWGGIDVLGRLAEGATVDQAAAEVELISARLREAYPATNGTRTYELGTFRDATMPVGIRSGILGFGWILIVLVMLVLFIACVNVANLLLTRAHARQREVAVRQSLGATKGRLFRQLLTETALLAVAGGATGVLLAFWANRLLGAIPLPLEARFVMDRNVLGFGGAATLLTGLAFGLAPAIIAAKREVASGLRDIVTGRRHKKRVSASEALVVLQVALSVAVLAAAGLFGRTLLNLRMLDPGFDSSGVLTAHLDPSLQGYGGDRVKLFYQNTLAAVAAVPGVRGVALSSRLPGPDADGTSIRIAGHVPAEGERLSMQFSTVSYDYFETLGIPVRRGRRFGGDDIEGGSPVVVLNETGARFIQDLTGSEALEAGISVQGPGGPFMEVVGVVADVRSGPPRQEPRPHMYWSFEQVPGGQGFANMALVVLGSGEPANLAGAVRSAVTDVDATVPLMSVRSLDAVLGEGVAQERLAATVLAVAAGLALLLASLGLYGVLTQAVARRTSEIGIRIALGAARGSVLRSVLLRALALTAVGLVVGLGVAMLAGRALAALLFGVSAQDATTLFGVVAVLLGVAVLASWVPAHRATRIDPVTALRVE